MTQEFVVEKESTALIPQARTPMDLMSIALENKAAIDVIERLAALQRDEREYQARVSFDHALNRCQAKLERISADANNPQTKSRYATYARLDKAVRPIYTEEGFSVSFGEKDCPTPGKTRFVAYLSRAGVTREYLKDITPSTKGPRGSDVMTQIHAEAAADSYAKRYLLKDIFNIAIGEDDSDGSLTNGWLSEQCEWLASAKDSAELKKLFTAAYTQASEANDRMAMATLIQAKDARKAELQ